ncbi:MAG: glycosyltransferase family 39 protein [Candidatus Terrybacteria bacterium]|nr:glycosyltransferase family 39 protein [Candidatus Terrybacteria bacterium]
MEEFFKKYSIFFLFLILILAVFFRVYQITAIPPGLYPDEAMNGNNALESIKTGEYKIFYPENNGREGLFINIQAQVIKIFNNEPWALRLASAIFGILTVLGTYLLTKQLFKKESIALFASFFLAVSFWHINFSRIGFRAIMAPFFLTWSMFLLIKIVNQVKKNFQFPIFKFQILILSLFSGLIFGLGFHSYIAYRITPIILLPLFFVLFKNRQFKAILFFIIGAAIAIYPLFNYFYHQPQDFLGRSSQVSIFSSESPVLELGKNILLTIGMFFVKGDSNWRHNFAGAPQLWWPMAILFLIGLIIGIWKLFENWKLKIENFFEKISYPETTLFLWLILGLLPVIISSEGLPHALRAIIVIPVTMIFAALGLNWIIGKLKPKLGALLLMAILIVIPINAYTQYFLNWTKNSNTASAFSKNYAQLGNYLRYSPKDIKKYVIVNADGIDVRGIPMPSQTVMFLTDTFLPEKQKEKNIYYLTREKIDENLEKIKKESMNEEVKIFMLESDPMLQKKIEDKLIYVYTYEDSGVMIQHKFPPPLLL